MAFQPSLNGGNQPQGFAAARYADHGGETMGGPRNVGTQAGHRFAQDDRKFNSGDDAKRRRGSSGE
jgi:hypothetical protein